MKERTVVTLAILDPREIQRAHDLLSALSNAPELCEMIMPSERDRALMSCALNVLCWVLAHDHANVFTENLLMVEKFLARLGLAFNGDEIAGAKDAPERTN